MALASPGTPPAASGTPGTVHTTILAAPVAAEHLAEVVAHEAVRATPRGEHRLEITLHPPELGRVELNMVVGRDSLQAHLVAHTEGARDLLNHHLADLREQLVAQGFTDPHLSVDLRHGSGHRGGYPADQGSPPPPRDAPQAGPTRGPVPMSRVRDRHILHLIA